MNEDDRNRFEEWSYQFRPSIQQAANSYDIAWAAVKDALASERTALIPIAKAIIRFAREEPQYRRRMTDDGVLQWAERVMGLE